MTLVEAPGERCWGRAFRLAPQDHERVMAGLDHREKGGYGRAEVRIRCAEGDIDALIYMAQPGNPNWLGPAPDHEIVAQILRSRGPSGPNPEYLLRLEQALVELGGPDPHVKALAEALRERQRALQR